MYPVRYHRPKDLAEAAALFAACEDASYLSGGHTLLPTMKQHLAAPSDLIDLAAIPALRGIEVAEGVLRIGAATSHGEVAASPLARQAIPALAGLAGSIGDRHIRHRGTIGGSVANNDPAADYPAGLVGLGATVVTDRRSLAADDFFVSLYETAREPGEIIVRIDFPIPELAAYAKQRSPASRYAVAAVFVTRGPEGVRVAVTGAGAGGVFRVAEFERALEASFRPEALDGLAVDPAGLMGDLNGSAEYRANLIAVMARRAVAHPGQALVFT
jgi:carbon-monoxide dehydrogenase medium subunit